MSESNGTPKEECAPVLTGATSHPYYCEPYTSGSLMQYDTWEDYLSGWDDADEDYNFLFRYDLSENVEGDPESKLQLKLFYLLQRKGTFTPVVVDNFDKKHLPDLEKRLRSSWMYMQKVWSEFSGVPKEG